MSSDGLDGNSGDGFDALGVFVKNQEQAEAARQKRRADSMRQFALSDSLTGTMSDMTNDMVHGIDADATAEKKLQKVMINAKERGLTVDQVC